MYIEFQLPTGAGGVSAAHMLYVIRHDLDAWQNKYNIPYRTKTIKYTHRVTFDSDDHYTLFSLTFGAEYKSSDKWRMILDPNNKN